MQQNFQDEELQHELFQRTSQKAKIRNSTAIIIMTDIQPSKAHLSNIIQLGGVLGRKLDNMMSNLGKRGLIDFAVPLAKEVLTKLAQEQRKYKLESRIGGKWAIATTSVVATRAEKGLTLFTPTEDMDNIIKTVESLEKMRSISWWC